MRSRPARNRQERHAAPPAGRAIALVRFHDRVIAATRWRAPARHPAGDPDLERHPHAHADQLHGILRPVPTCRKRAAPDPERSICQLTRTKHVMVTLQSFRDSVISGLRTSVGFGFRWLSPIGPLRFEWGIPLDRQPDEEPLVFEFTIGNFF